MKRNIRGPCGRKPTGPVGDVELGYSFFEKVGCSPESSAHLVTKRTSSVKAAFRNVLHPGLAFSTGRDGEDGEAVRCVEVRVVLRSPGFDASGGSNRRFERHGRGASSAMLPCG
jgi:hypothetical protein